LLRFSSLNLGRWCHQAPVTSDTDGYDITADAGVIKQVLLECDAPLFAIGLHIDLAHAKLDIKVGYALV
jgi:hypothetical protein